MKSETFKNERKFSDVMRLIALIGTLLTLILPFAYVIVDNPFFETTLSYGFLFTSGTFTVGSNQLSSNTETFQLSWITEDNGLYHFYFDPLFAIGVLIFVALLVNIVLSVISSDNKNEKLPGFVLLACGIALLVVRLVALNDVELSFYQNDETFIGNFRYIEIPIGFLIAVIFGILDLRK